MELTIRTLKIINTGGIRNIVGGAINGPPYHYAFCTLPLIK